MWSAVRSLPRPAGRLALRYSTAQEPAPVQGSGGEWVVYKGHGLMSVKLIPGRSWPAPDGRLVERPGSLLLEFLPKLPGGELKYDFQQRIKFALAAKEVAELLKDDFGEKGVHITRPDGLNHAEPGKALLVTKREKKGYYFRVSAGGAAVGVPLTTGEFMVFKVLMAHCIHKILKCDS